MTEKPSTAETAATSHPPFNLQAGFAVNQKNMEAASQLNQKFFKAVRTYNDELLTFGSNRLKEDIAVSQKLAECKSPEEVVRVYTGFIQTAFKQYTEEATHMAQLYNALADETIASATEAIAEATEVKGNGKA